MIVKNFKNRSTLAEVMGKNHVGVFFLNTVYLFFNNKFVCVLKVTRLIAFSGSLPEFVV